MSDIKNNCCEDQDDLIEEQNEQQEQIIQSGAVTTTKGRHVIHCLTVVGQMVSVDNELENTYISA